VVLAVIGVVVAIFFYADSHRPCSRDCAFREMGIDFSPPPGWDFQYFTSPRLHESNNNDFYDPIRGEIAIRLLYPDNPSVQQALISITLHRADGLSLQDWYIKVGREYELHHPDEFKKNWGSWNPQPRLFPISIGGENAIVIGSSSETTTGLIVVQHGDAVYVILPIIMALRDPQTTIVSFLRTIKFTGTPKLFEKL
jgi:hypothetical protein